LASDPEAFHPCVLSSCWWIDRLTDLSHWSNSPFLTHVAGEKSCSACSLVVVHVVTCTFLNLDWITYHRSGRLSITIIVRSFNLTLLFLPWCSFICIDQCWCHVDQHVRSQPCSHYSIGIYNWSAEEWKVFTFSQNGMRSLVSCANFGSRSI
jgi:hypothetical protein